MSFDGTDMMIEVLGEKAVARRLGRVKWHVENWAPIWPEVITHLERTVKRQFDSQGVYGGGSRWTPITDSWKKQKQREGRSPDIMRYTGRLEDSFLVDDHEEHLSITMANELWWGTTVPYASYHQHGTDIMPVRKLIQPPEGSRRQMVRILQRYSLANQPTAGVTA